MSLKLNERKWHLVDDGILPYALAAMRSLWVWPLLHLWTVGMAPEIGDLLTWPAVYGLLALSTLIAQVAVFRVRADRRAMLLVAFSGLAALFLTLFFGPGHGRVAPWHLRWLAEDVFAVLTTLLATVWLWWWGLIAGRETLHYETYAGNFALGTGALGLVAIITYATHRQPLATLLGPVLAFFAVSLCTLAIASLRSARRFEREDPTFRVSRYWVITVAGVTAALLVAGLLLAQLFTPEVIRRLLDALALLTSVLARVIYWVAVAIAWVFFALFGWLLKLVRVRRESRDEEAPLQMPANLVEQLKSLDQQPAGLSPELFLILRVVAGVLIVVAVLVIFALAFRRFRTYFEEDVEEERESVLSLDLLKAQLTELFRRKVRTPAPPPFAVVAGDDPRAQIRRTYQALLGWAAQHDLARPAGMTPEEYLGLVGQAQPDHRPALALITAAYVQARYSLDPVPHAVAEETARAWELIARGDASH